MTTHSIGSLVGKLTVGDLRKALATGGFLSKVPDSAPVVVHGCDETLITVKFVAEIRAQALGGSLSRLSAREQPTHPQARVCRVLVLV